MVIGDGKVSVKDALKNFPNCGLKDGDSHKEWCCHLSGNRQYFNTPRTHDTISFPFESIPNKCLHPGGVCNFALQERSK